MENSMKEQRAANAEIISLRSAASASARETRRAQKAASRAASSGATPSSLSGWNTPQHKFSIRAEPRSQDRSTLHMLAAVEDELGDRDANITIEVDDASLQDSEAQSSSTRE